MECELCHASVDMEGAHVQGCSQKTHVTHLRCYRNMMIEDSMATICPTCSFSRDGGIQRGPGVPIDSGSIANYPAYVELLKKRIEYRSAHAGGHRNATLDDVRAYLQCKTPVAKLKEIVTFAKIKRHSATVEHFIENGYSLRDILYLGVTSRALFSMGLTDVLLRKYRRPGEALSAASIVLQTSLSGAMIFSMACDSDIERFLAIGYTAEDLRLLNVTLDNLVAWGFGPTHKRARFLYGDDERGAPLSREELELLLQASAPAMKLAGLE